MNKKFSVAVVGAGGIGSAVALILAEYSALCPVFYLGDVRKSAAEDAVNWLQSGTAKAVEAHAFEMPYDGINEAMRAVFEKCDIVLDCLPGSQAPRIAAYALEYKMHYANLTEYVQETKDIVAMAKEATTGFILQTGLAPGFINILAHQLYDRFVDQFGDQDVHYMGMKVGAITDHAYAPHFYGFTWSPIGVATEYVKKAEVVRNGQMQMIDALSERETILIDGTTYEADLTSGGAADMPAVYAHKISNIDYKTIRYPGHYAWVEKILKNAQGNPIEYLQQQMLDQVPMVEDDQVIIHANVMGKDKNGLLRSVEKAYKILPSTVGKHKLRAIQSTTASALAQACAMLLEGQLKDVVFQSEIDPDAFLNGKFVAPFYK